MKSQRSFRGRRGFWVARISGAVHLLEPWLFGLGLAAGMFLITRQAGVFVLLDRHGGGSYEVGRAGVLLLVGVMLVAASLLFFHRKPRLLRHRLTAAGVALAFFVLGYAREVASVHAGAFFGLSTLTARAGLVEEAPGPPKVRYAVNGLGLRGDEWAAVKARGVVRVAVVGDAFVFGAGVEEADTLPRQLGERLRARFPEVTFEVLNLGLPGDHLRSHLRKVRVAERELGADVVVLCLTLPDDLSAWDGQEECAEHGRVGGFSFVSFLFGHAAAITLWSERNVARELTPERLAFLDAEVTRFTAESDAAADKPLVVFAYASEEPRVTAALQRLPKVTLVPAVRPLDDYFAPTDGQPTAAGNKVFSRMIGRAIEPSWVVPK